MPTFDPVALGLSPIMSGAEGPSEQNSGQGTSGTQTEWFRVDPTDSNKFENWDMSGNYLGSRVKKSGWVSARPTVRNIAAMIAMAYGIPMAAEALGGAAAGGGMGDAGAGLGWMGGADGVGLGTMGDALAGSGAGLGAGAGGGMATDLTALGELGGYGFTSTEVAGAAPTLLGEAGLEAAAAGAGGAATVAGAGAGTVAGAGAGAAGLGTLGSLASLASIGSGIYGMYKANQLADQAQTNADKAAPWTSGVVTPGSGQQVAGDALKNVISGDFSNDAGFKLAQLSAARTSAQQPGGYSASAAANAAIKYQNDRILALSAPAGVGYNPSASAATAGTQAANTLAGQSLGSIGFGLSGAGAVSPQLQALLLKYGLV